MSTLRDGNPSLRPENWSTAIETASSCVAATSRSDPKSASVPSLRKHRQSRCGVLLALRQTIRENARRLLLRVLERRVLNRHRPYVLGALVSVCGGRAVGTQPVVGNVWMIGWHDEVVGVVKLAGEAVTVLKDIRLFIN